jgi:hypothetical protein
MGVFLDPPYDPDECGSVVMYPCSNPYVCKEVEDWCRANGDRPHLRIAYCGLADTCDLERYGWSPPYKWKNAGGAKDQRDKECIWFSPHCKKVES